MDIIINKNKLSVYAKYQFISKFILTIIFFPLFHLIRNFLLSGAGISNFTSGNWKEFIISIRGFIFLLVSLAFLLLIFAVDILTFVIIAAYFQEEKEDFTIMEVLKKAFSSLGLFISPYGAILVLYVAFIVPLVGIGKTLSPMKDFAIPNFISSVIYSSRLYTAIYILLIAIFLIWTIRYIFTIHYVIISRMSVREAMKSSVTLVSRHWKEFLREYVLRIVKISISYIFIFAVISLVFGLLFFNVDLGFLHEDSKIIVFFLTVFELIALFFLGIGPLLISLLTDVFYRYNRKDGHMVSIGIDPLIAKHKKTRGWKFKTSMFIVKILVFFVAISSFNIAISIFAENYYSELFKESADPIIIAHRGGGILGNENTVKGVEATIDIGVDFTEIDVQRTLDGHYIINHDKTFKRLCDSNIKVSDISLNKLKQLRIDDKLSPNKFKSPVATLEDMLTVSKDRIGIFLELKGKTADKKMVKDIVKILKKRGMEDDIVLLSLDYNLIEYINHDYPNMKTGFLYYFKSGDIKTIKTDYYIMEEREVSYKNILDIHDIGKKAIVWTVNDSENAKKYIDLGIDGIITDDPLMCINTVKEMNNREKIERIIDKMTAYIF